MIMRGKEDMKIVKMESANTEKLQVSEEQKKLFRLIMNNINSFSTGKSNKKKIGLVAAPISLLFVDRRYQGLRVHKNLKDLISHWDERKLGAICIVPHPEEYRFAVVDGQGRMLAATELGYETLQAIVLMDAPENELERLKFEAEIFIGQDDQTESVKALEKHPARVIIGDPAAIALEEMFNKYHINYVDTKGKREESTLGSYPSTYEIAKRHGKHCLDFIFSIIQNAGWNKETNGYATFVTEAIKDVWTTFQNEADRKEIHKFLCEEFRQIDPTLFSSQARAKYLMRKDTRACCKLYVEDMLYKGIGLKRPDMVA